MVSILDYLEDSKLPAPPPHLHTYISVSNKAWQLGNGLNLFWFLKLFAPLVYKITLKMIVIQYPYYRPSISQIYQFFLRFQNYHRCIIFPSDFMQFYKKNLKLSLLISSFFIHFLFETIILILAEDKLTKTSISKITILNSLQFEFFNQYLTKV